jgi:hypothetical protein
MFIGSCMDELCAHVSGYGKGRILCGDVGQSAYEEIDIVKKGANYGWNALEGFECFNNATCDTIGRKSYC